MSVQDRIRRKHSCNGDLDIITRYPDAILPCFNLVLKHLAAMSSTKAGLYTRMQQSLQSDASSVPFNAGMKLSHPFLRIEVERRSHSPMQAAR